MSANPVRAIASGPLDHSPDHINTTLSCMKGGIGIFLKICLLRLGQFHMSLPVALLRWFETLPRISRTHINESCFLTDEILR